MGEKEVFLHKEKPQENKKHDEIYLVYKYTFKASVAHERLP